MGFGGLGLGEDPVQIVDGQGRVRAVSDDLEAVTGTGSRSVVPVREELAQRVGDRVAVRCELGPVEVAGSRGQLARVLGNLVDNAQRHARDEVRVTVREEGDWGVVEVADDGSGVPEGERERVFERFVRLDDARSRDDGGAGLGLAIARDVVLRHGGRLSVRTAPGGGALFEVRLPRKAPA
jgi:signal transduction histidine kinase